MPVTQGDCDNIAYSDMLGITRDSVCEFPPMSERGRNFSSRLASGEVEAEPKSSFLYFYMTTQP